MRSESVTRAACDEAPFKITLTLVQFNSRVYFTDHLSLSGRVKSQKQHKKALFTRSNAARRQALTVAHPVSIHVPRQTQHHWPSQSLRLCACDSRARPR